MNKIRNEEGKKMRNEELGIRNKHFSSIIMLIFVYALIFVFGCKEPFSEIQHNELQPGMGAFSLSVDNARTILPNTTIDSFQVFTLNFTGTETLSVDRTKATRSDPVNLKAGNYSLTVTAYMDTAKTKPAASGSLSGIIIEEGKTTTNTIPLTPLGMTAGKGTFSWNIDFPTGLSKASMKITPVNTATGTAEQTLYFTGGAPQVNKTDSVELNSGVYRVVFTLVKDANTQAFTWRDAVHVYQNMTSVFNYTFSEKHFNNIKYTVTFVYNDGTTPDSMVNCLHGEKVKVPASPTRTGYTFDGWYTDNNSFLNKWDFDTALIGDIPLYAKWKQDPVYYVYNEPTWNEAVNSIKTGGNNKTHYIKVRNCR